MEIGHTYLHLSLLLPQFLSLCVSSSSCAFLLSLHPCYTLYQPPFSISSLSNAQPQLKENSSRNILDLTRHNHEKCWFYFRDSLQFLCPLLVTFREETLPSFYLCLLKSCLVYSRLLDQLPSSLCSSWGRWRRKDDVTSSTCPGMAFSHLPVPARALMRSLTPGHFLQYSWGLTIPLVGEQAGPPMSHSEL